MYIGEMLAELRKDRGLKQQDITELLHVSDSTISAHEVGSREPSLDMLVEYARFFNVSTDYLLGMTPDCRNPAILSEVFCDGLTYGHLLQELQKLTPEMRSAFLSVLKAMVFCAENQDQLNRNGEAMK